MSIRRFKKALPFFGFHEIQIYCAAVLQSFIRLSGIEIILTYLTC